VDKNSIIGLTLIAIILGVWVYLTTPSAEELAKQRRIRDSIALAESKTLQQNEIKNKIEDKTALPKVSDSTAVKNDSIILSEKQNYYKDFFIATKGEEKLYTLENEKFRITFTNKGGRIKQVELKEYHRYRDTSYLKLFDNDSTYYSLALDAYERSRIFHTDSFYFSVPTIEKK